MRRYQIEKESASGEWNPVNKGYYGELEAVTLLELIRDNMADGCKYRVVEVMQTRVIK